jgi:hypothetical protein
MHAIGAPMPGSPLTLNRSRRQSRVRATYAVSLGVSPRRMAQVRSVRSAIDCLHRPAWTIRSRHSIRPCPTGPGATAPASSGVALRLKPATRSAALAVKLGPVSQPGDVRASRQVPAGECFSAG